MSPFGGHLHTWIIFQHNFHHHHHLIFDNVQVRGNIHISEPPSRQLACCTNVRSCTRSPGMSIMRVDIRELPLSAIPVSCFHVILGLPGTCFPSAYMSQVVLIARLELSICPYQLSLLSFRMRSRSSMPSCANSSLALEPTAFLVHPIAEDAVAAYFSATEGAWKLA